MLFNVAYELDLVEKSQVVRGSQLVEAQSSERAIEHMTNLLEEQHEDEIQLLSIDAKEIVG